MKIFRARFLSLAAPVLLALALPADEVGFHPKANAELEKKLEVEIELKLEDLSLEMNGETVDPENMGAMGDETMLVHLLVGVTDKYVESKDGRPTDLLRTFDELELTGEFGDEKKPAQEFDDIQGQTVRFKWNEETQSYERTFHESKGEDEKIANLLEDMDLRMLLPEKKVSEGDTWEVPGEKLAPLFLPGGIPGAPPSGDDSEKLAMIKEALDAELQEFLKEFKVICKYTGSREADGARVGAIEIQYEGRADVDLSGLAEKLAEESGGEANVQVDAKAGLTLKGEGELLWDLAAGHVHAFSMRSDVGISADVQASVDAQGQTFEMSMSAKLGGKATWALTTSKP